jgi:hypothetical protein
MRAGRRLQGLAPALTVAMLLAAPAVASATPRWLINYRLAEAKHEGLVSYGTLALENHFLGKITCQALTAGSVWNQSERGEAQTEGFATYACATELMCHGTFAVAEEPLEVKKEGEGKKPQAVRGPSGLPWYEELTEKEGQRTLKINRALLTTVVPCLSLEVPFEGALEPVYVNGAGNGLSASRLQFKGGKCPCLTTTKLGSGNEENILHLSGELTNIGVNVQLITAE